MGINIRFFGELMNIELKYRFKYHFVVASLAILTLFFGAVGISYGIGGLTMLPLIAGFLAALISVEKRRIASIAVSVILIIGETLIGFYDYFTLTSVTSVTVAVIMAFHFLKKREKSESALFGTMLTAFVIIASAAMYISASTGASSLPEIYEHFLEVYDAFKQSTIASIIDASAQTGNASLSLEYMNEVFDAYLNCIVAVSAVIAFLLVGLGHKIFCGLMCKYVRNPDDVKYWRFMPAKAFAYFYFVLAVLTMLQMDESSVIDVSIANLYLIFMFVFAYIGFRFASVALSKGKRKTVFSALAVAALIVLFSSFAVQLLAAGGAFVSIYRANIAKDETTSTK